VNLSSAESILDLPSVEQAVFWWIDGEGDIVEIRWMVGCQLMSIERLKVLNYLGVHAGVS
jgi:hypothetical protein